MDEEEALQILIEAASSHAYYLDSRGYKEFSGFRQEMERIHQAISVIERNLS